MTPDQANTTVSDERLQELVGWCAAVQKHGASSSPFEDMEAALTELSARRATADVTEAMVERAWDYFDQANEWAPPKNHLRAALLAALNPPMGR